MDFLNINKIIGFLLCFAVVSAYAKDDKEAAYVATCPAVAVCKPSDGPKKNKAYAKINQSAYDCYRFIGEADLAQVAATAATKCLTIYGSTTATISSENSKLTAP